MYVDRMRFSIATRISAVLLTAALIATACTSSEGASTPAPTATPLVFAEPTDLPDQTPPTKVPIATPEPATATPTETPTTEPTATPDADPSTVDLPDGFVISDLQPENSSPLAVKPIDPDSPFQYPNFEWWHQFAFQEEVNAFWLGLQHANESLRLDSNRQIEPDGLLAQLIADGLIDPDIEAQDRASREASSDSYTEVDVNNMVDLRVVRDISGLMTIVTCQQQAGQVIDFDTGDIRLELSGSAERMWFFAPKPDSFEYVFVGVASRNGSADLFGECPGIAGPVDLVGLGVLAS